MSLRKSFLEWEVSAGSFLSRLIGPPYLQSMLSDECHPFEILYYSPTLEIFGLDSSVFLCLEQGVRFLLLFVIGDER